MLSRNSLRAVFFAVHGTLALAAGLALIYLRQLITNPLFEAMAVITALVLAGTSLALAGIADWFAVLGARKSPMQMCLYILGGVCCVGAGAFLGFSSLSTLWLLVLLTIAHGLVFGTVAIGTAFRMRQFSFDSCVLVTFGAISVAISGWLAGVMPGIGDRTALGWIGLYLCIVGLKMFFFAGDDRYRSLHPGTTATAPAAAARS